MNIFFLTFLFKNDKKISDFQNICPDFIWFISNSSHQCLCIYGIYIIINSNKNRRNTTSSILSFPLTSISWEFELNRLGQLFDLCLSEVWTIYGIFSAPKNIAHLPCTPDIVGHICSKVNISQWYSLGQLLITEILINCHSIDI